MRKIAPLILLALLFAAYGRLAAAAPAKPAAASLPPPTGLTCSVADADENGVGDTIMADWDDVAGAKKYSVGVVAGYDTNGDSSVDTTLDFDFGTSDRTDGAPIGQSDLPIPLGQLDQPFELNGEDVTLSPIEVQLRVKALNPGKGRGRQNNEFSNFCTAVSAPS